MKRSVIAGTRLARGKPHVALLAATADAEVGSERFGGREKIKEEHFHILCAKTRREVSV